jgi:hypothetical protein
MVLVLAWFQPPHVGVSLALLLVKDGTGGVGVMVGYLKSNSVMRLATATVETTVALRYCFSNCEGWDWWCGCYGWLIGSGRFTSG